MDETLVGLQRWVCSRVEDFGWQIVGEVELVKQRPWATVVTADTDAGRVFAKANCAGLRSEGPLLQRLAQWTPESVLAPLDVDVENARLLLRDGGQTLLAMGLQADASAWAPVLANVAATQRSTLGRVDELLAAGVPDFRPSTVCSRLEQLVSDLGLAGSQRDRALALIPGLCATAAELDSLEIEAGISHGDIQPNNMFGPPTSKPFDWGDAVIAHPFCTLTSLRSSLDDQKLFDLLRDQYLSHWTDMGSMDDLRRLADSAQLVGCVAAIWTWVRVGPSAMALHPSSVPTWFDRIESALLERRDES